MDFYLIKLIYKNERPFWTNHKIKVDNCSLGFGNPSGHSARSTIIFLSLYYYTAKLKCLEKKNIIKKILIIPFLLIIFSVMYSRVFEGKHTFNQILFGFSFGIFFYILWFYLLKIQNYTSRMFFDFVGSIYLYIFCLLIILLPFPIYFITSYFTDINKLEELIPKYCYKNNFSDNKKFFKTGLISAMKTTLLIGGLVGILFDKRIKKMYPSVDEETILEWKNNNLRVKLLRIIIIICFGAIPKIVFSIIKYKGNSFLYAIIYEIPTNIIEGFFIYGFGVFCSYLLFNSCINKIDNDSLNTYGEILPNETSKDDNEKEKDNVTIKNEIELNGEKV